MYALRCKIQIETGTAVRRTFAEQIAKHQEEEKKIRANAETWGVTLETGVRLERILAEFLLPMPKIVVWFVSRQLRKNGKGPQVGHTPVIRGLNRQGVFTLVQSLFFLGFLVAGFVYTAAI